MHNRFRDILLMRKTGKVISDSSMFDKRLGAYLNDRDYGGIITTATGNPVSIVTNKAQNALDLQIAFSPKQSGSGIPSPDNIRPIVPWTALGLSKCGKNLVDVQGATVTSQTTVFDYFILKKGTYALSVDAKNNTSIRGRFRVVDYSTSAYIGGITIEGYAEARISSSFTITEDRTCKIVASGESAGYSFSFDNVQLELGANATPYEPYITPTTNTYSLGGTYYGFTLDVVTGELTVNYAIVDLGSLSWTYQSNYTRFRASVSGRKGCGDTEKVGVKCEVYSEITQAQTRGTAGYFDNSIAVGLTGNSYIYVIDRRYTDGDSLKSALDNIYLAYPLATPITVSLTPAEVALLAGNNTLWTDGDSLSVTYKAPKS